MRGVFLVLSVWVSFVSLGQAMDPKEDENPVHPIAVADDGEEAADDARQRALVARGEIFQEEAQKSLQALSTLLNEPKDVLALRMLEHLYGNIFPQCHKRSFQRSQSAKDQEKLRDAFSLISLHLFNNYSIRMKRLTSTHTDGAPPVSTFTAANAADREELESLYVPAFNHFCHVFLPLLEKWGYASWNDNRCVFPTSFPLLSLMFLRSELEYPFFIFENKGIFSTGPSWGYRQGETRQHFVFCDGELIRESGLCVTAFPLQNACRVIWQFGSHTSHPFTCYPQHAFGPLRGRDKDNPLSQFLRQALGDTFFEPQRTEQYEAFIPLFFHNHRDISGANLLFLEDLQQADDAEAVALRTEIEREVGAPVSAICEDLNADIQRECLEEVQEEIRKEQEAISQRVARERVPGKKKKGGKRKASAERPQKGGAAVHGPSVKERAGALYQKWRQEGRVKYRGFLTLMNGVMQQFKKDGGPALKQSQRGSHVTFHPEGGESLTFVVPHGGADRSLPASRVNRFLQGLIERFVVESLHPSLPSS